MLLTLYPVHLPFYIGDTMSAGIYDNINIINFSFQFDKIVLTCDYVIDKT